MGKVDRPDYQLEWLEARNNDGWKLSARYRDAVSPVLDYIATLERRLEEAQAAEKAAYENTDSVLHTLTKDCKLLQRRLEESESERVYYKDRLKPAFNYVDGKAVSISEDEIDRLERRLAEVEAERDRLRKALLHLVGKYENPTLSDSSDLYEIAKAALRREGGDAK